MHTSLTRNQSPRIKLSAIGHSVIVTPPTWTHECFLAEMDEEPPFNLALNVYKGPESIPHASAEVFGAFFLATNTALLAHMFPGKLFGSELHVRKWDPDYIASCCNEQGMRREALQGKKPHMWLLGGGPRLVNDSWERMWWDNLHWKRWKIQRTGPAFPQDMYWQ